MFGKLFIAISIALQWDYSDNNEYYPITCYILYIINIEMIVNSYIDCWKWEIVYTSVKMLESNEYFGCVSVLTKDFS